MPFENKIRFKRSESTDATSFAKESNLELGEIALSVNENNPGLYFETVDDKGGSPSVVKLSPVYIGNEQPSGYKSDSDLWFDKDANSGTLKIRVDNNWKNCISVPPATGAQTNKVNEFTAKQQFKEDIEIKSSASIVLEPGANITDKPNNTTVSDINFLRIDNQLTIANDKKIILGGTGQITLGGSSTINVTGDGKSVFKALDAGAITSTGAISGKKISGTSFSSTGAITGTAINGSSLDIRKSGASKAGATITEAGAISGSTITSGGAITGKKINGTAVDIRKENANTAALTIDSAGNIDCKKVEANTLQADEKIISNDCYHQKVNFRLSDTNYLNWNDGDYQTRTFTESTAITFTGTKNDNEYARALIFELNIPDDTVEDEISLTWPENVHFPNGMKYNEVPPIEKGKTHLFVFIAIGNSSFQRFYGTYLTGFNYKK